MFCLFPMVETISTQIKLLENYNSGWKYSDLAQTDASMKKNSKKFYIRKIVENYISHYIASQRNSVYFLSNVSGCARITGFPNTLVAKN